MFSTYFELGIRHIADLDAYDHMLFILALIAGYRVTDLKRIVLLVTAFTLGHSLTLALSTLDLVKVRSEYVEFLIPVTILLTAITNLVRGSQSGVGNMAWKYSLAAFFGLIHGFGFSNYLKALLGNEGDVFVPLLAFNIGVEVGQIIIVLAILILEIILFQILRFKHRDWILVVSGACLGIALILVKDTIFW